MNKKPLGNSELMASPLGLGCMGMSECYGARNDKESVATIHRSVELGLNFFDTADVYGNGHNESLVGKALKPVRQDVILATKFGFLPNESGLNGRPEYARQACDASLLRLGTDYIDVYYLHRIDPDVPIAETVGAMSNLVEEGKVRYLGLSEVSAHSLREAYAVHPITALQMEYSVWVRDIETDILSCCRELGCAVVPYSPLGRGVLTGKISNPLEFGEQDYRRDIPMFQDENFMANTAIVVELKKIASAKNCSPGQLALAWLGAQGDDVFPIPGTKRRVYLDENIKSLQVELSTDEISRINELSKAVLGQRKNAAGMKLVDTQTASR